MDLGVDRVDLVRVGPVVEGALARGCSLYKGALMELSLSFYIFIIRTYILM